MKSQLCLEVEEPEICVNYLPAFWYWYQRPQVSYLASLSFIPLISTMRVVIVSPVVINIILPFNYYLSLTYYVTDTGLGPGSPIVNNTNKIPCGIYILGRREKEETTNQCTNVYTLWCPVEMSPMKKSWVESREERKREMQMHTEVFALLLARKWSN